MSIITMVIKPSKFLNTLNTLKPLIHWKHPKPQPSKLSIIFVWWAVTLFCFFSFWNILIFDDFLNFVFCSFKNIIYLKYIILIITNILIYSKQYHCKFWGTGLENPPLKRPKNSVFLRNRGRWFRIWSWFSRQSSSFGDICILSPTEICITSTSTSCSCTPWSQFFYSNFFSKIFNFLLFIMLMIVMRVYLGYLLWGCM